MTDPGPEGGIIARAAAALERGDEEAALAAACDGYGLYNRGGIDAMLELMTEDVKWSEGSDVPEPEVFSGREGVRSQQLAFTEAWDEVRFTPKSIHGDARRAVVVLEIWARGRGSGAEVTAEVANLWEIRDGLISRLEVFFDPQKALAAIDT